MTEWKWKDLDTEDLGLNIRRRLQPDIAGEKRESVMDDIDSGKTSLPHIFSAEWFSSQQNAVSLSMKPLSFYL